MGEREAKHAEALRAAQEAAAAHEATIAQLRADAERAGKEHARSIGALRAQHEVAIREREQQHSRALGDRSAARTELHAARTAATEHQAAAARLQTQLERAERAHAAELAALRSERAERDAALTTSHAETVQQQAGEIASLQAQLSASERQRDASRPAPALPTAISALETAPEPPSTPLPRSSTQRSAVERAASRAGRQTPERRPSTSTGSPASGRSTPDADRQAPQQLPPWVGHSASAQQVSATLQGVEPEVVDAITQTMIGEWLYKYTRRSFGRSGYSDRRHARYFFVHPYNRTIHWTQADPSTAAGAEGKSKTALIEQVALVDDYNPSPPGLYYQSIVIRTASREIKITAPSKARHRIWCTALNYLMEQHDNAMSAGAGAGASTSARAAHMSIPLELGGQADASSAGSTATRTPASPGSTLRSHRTVRGRASMNMPPPSHANASPRHTSVQRKSSEQVLGAHPPPLAPQSPQRISMGGGASVELMRPVERSATPSASSTTSEFRVLNDPSRIGSGVPRAAPSVRSSRRAVPDTRSGTPVPPFRPSSVASSGRSTPSAAPRHSVPGDATSLPTRSSIYGSVSSRGAAW